MTTVPTPEEIAEWSHEERAAVARALDIHIERPARHRRTRLQRRALIAVTMVSAAVLLPWVGLLSVTLRETSSGGAWRAAWVGFDAFLLASFAISAYVVWRHRQVAIVAVTVTATLLLTDAWFDITLSWNTPEFRFAVLSAVIVELPLALALVVAVFRMLRLNALLFRSLRGQSSTPVKVRSELVPTAPLEA